jgi:mono/diheme cytochrome c family protein
MGIKPRWFWWLALLLPACQQEMAKQPKYLPYQESDFWGDARSARPPVPGTVARGQLRDDAHLYLGRLNTQEQQLHRAAALIARPDLGGILGLAGVDVSQVEGTYVRTFPFPVTEEVMRRGRERYNIFCSVCHDYRGTGHGIVVQRGFTAPPSLTAPTLVDGQLRYDLSRGFRVRGIELEIRKAPVGYYYQVITNGFGSMPDYATQVPPRDRWAIIAYLRALQLSQSVEAGDLSPEERRKVERGEGP